MNQLNQKNYYRIMLGRKSIFAKECYEGKWIGAGWLKSSSLENELVENWRDFNKMGIPYPLKKPPGIPRGHASKRDKDAAVSEAEQIIQNRDWDRN